MSSELLQCINWWCCRLWPRLVYIYMLLLLRADDGGSGDDEIDDEINIIIMIKIQVKTQLQLWSKKGWEFLRHCVIGPVMKTTATMTASPSLPQPMLFVLVWCWTQAYSNVVLGGRGEDFRYFRYVLLVFWLFGNFLNNFGHDWSPP